MKRFFMIMALISACLCPALLAQGTPLSPVVPGSDKLRVNGNVAWFELEDYIGAYIKLTFNGRPVAGAKVWLNKWPLMESGGPGDYHVTIRHVKPRVGFLLEVAVELPNAPLRVGKMPFTGRQVLASHVIDNLIEWVFPTPGQVIDLSTYPAGAVPFRWNFTGATVLTRFDLTPSTDPDRVLYQREIEAERLDVPVRFLAPGTGYRIILFTSLSGMDPMGEFKMGKLVALGSKIIFAHDSTCPFSIRPAK